MPNQKSSGHEKAEQHAEHLKNLAAPGSNYAFGYLNGLVGAFVDGHASEEYLRKVYAELQADMKKAEQ